MRTDVLIYQNIEIDQKKLLINNVNCLRMTSSGYGLGSHSDWGEVGLA